MANPAPFEAFPVPPEAPYTWNDPRICYNEPCFAYNGGFDLVCLFGDATPARRVGGKSTSATAGRQYPEPETLSLIFKTCIDYVNDEEYNDEAYCDIKQYKFKKELDVNLKIEELTTQGKTYKLTSEVFSPKVIKKHLSSSAGKLAKKKTSVSSSIKTLKLKSYVSSSLVLSRPRRINFKSSIIKKGKK